jgi:hypothetical protein
MALANLNINVSANVSNVINAMADVKAVTHANMIGSSAAVNDFQKNFVKDAAQVQAQSKAIGAEMGASSIAINKAAQISSDSMSNVTAAANASLAGVKELSKGMDAAGAKINAAMGPEAAAQVKETTARVEEFVATRVAIAAVGLALGAVAATIVGVGVAAYHAAGFMKGLITGDSYKSKNIDALIATNTAVIDLQRQLSIAAQDANALKDALSRLGINKADIIAVAGNADTKMHGDKAELDRLGVAYKDLNGQILENSVVVQNAKNKLDEYTPGWDRNSAAIAMGFGSYEQINNYLRVNQQELQNSKQRLDEYGLGIGTDTQAAVSRYQVAMLEFNNETRLMGEGFKRVIADNVMPILTNFSTYLKEGWPAAVNFFRGVTWAFSSILLGLDSAAYISVKSLIASLTAIVDVSEGVVLAMGKLATGDVKGAMSELSKGWNNAETTIGAAADKIVEHAKNTNKALLSGIAFDDRSDPLGAKPPKGKTFIPAPVVPAAVAAAVEKPVAVGIWTLEDDKLWKNIQKHMEQSGKDWADEMGLIRQDQEKAAQAMSDLYQEVLMDQEALRRESPWEGMKSGIQDYADSVKDLGTQFGDMAVNTMQQMESALTNFVMTGKLNFKDLANSIISDLIRIQMRQAVVGIFGQIASSVGSAFGNYVNGYDSGTMEMANNPPNLSGARAAGGPVTGGQSYLVGERGPEIFTPGASGGITPNNALGGNMNLTVNVVNQSGQQVKAKDGGSSFDGKSMVKTIILEAMDTDPSFRWAMRGA